MIAVARSIGCMVLTLSLLVPAGAVAQPGATLEDARDQGILYLRKGLFKQARDRLKAAVKMPGGAQDFRSHFYLSRAAYELLLLEEAFEFVELAGKLAEGDRQVRSVSDARQEMAALFGGVVLVPDPQETKQQGRIYFEAKTGIINKDKKQRFLSIRERFRSIDVKLPTKVFLPYGEYRANGVQFTLAEGEEAPEVPIFLQAADSIDEDGKGDSKLWWYVGLGGAAAVAAVVTTVLLLDAPTPDRANVQLGY